LYEAIRPLVLFHETAGERAKEIDVPQRTLSRKADEFERYGMQSLFSSGEQGGARETGRTLPPEIRQLIVDLHVELPTMSWREIAEVCYIRYARRPDHKSVKHLATATPPPSRKERRYQPWHQILDPAERKLAAIRLHAEGWSVTSITEVKNARRLETHFRSPQLDLWQLSDTEWLLALRRPEPSPYKRPSKIVALAEQLVLPEFDATG
jgi:putative transposase